VDGGHRREPDPEFPEDPGGEGHKPTSHLRSREEYVGGLRNTWKRWLPDVPVPPDWRDGASGQANPEAESNNSGTASGRDMEGPLPRRTQDRVRRHPNAPLSFRSRPPIHKQAKEGHAIGVGYLVLTLRELASLSQRTLAKRAGTSQGAITRVETGVHTPSIPSVLRLAEAVGYRVVMGLASPDVATIEPTAVTLEDLALVGLLVPDPLDGLPNFRVIREPPPWAGAS
jgi:transcriptional regulator with XRE-family HTH domain